MWRLAAITFLVNCVLAENIATPRSGNDLVYNVLTKCSAMECVKENVLAYLDGILNIQSDARSVKNMDQAIFKRAARVVKTHEFRIHLPETLFGSADVVYNPKSGLDIASMSKGTSNVASRGNIRGRGLLFKKKLLLPALLLFKLKMKALMPIFVALIGIKSLKALILSKLAIVIVVGFIAYQFLSKSGMPMPMPMSMTPIEPPMSMYGPPSTSPPSSYEPGWEPSGGPYSRVGTSGSTSDNGQGLAYSSYYPGASLSTNQP